MKNFCFLFLLCATTLCFFSCKDDDGDDDPSNDLLKPTVTFEPGGYTTEAGVSIKISPIVTNKENCAYSWKTAGQEISTDTVLNFSSEEAKDHSIQLTVTNPYGSAEASCTVTVQATPPYKNAILMLDAGARGDMGDETLYSQLFAINTKGELLGDVFKSVNGKSLGALSTMCRYNNKIYILSDEGVEDRNKAEYTVIDAQTMECEKTLSVDLPGFTSTISGLYIFGDSQAYISKSDNSLYSFNIETGTAGNKITVPGNFTTNSKLPLISMNGKIYGASSGMMKSHIFCLDPQTNTYTETSIDGQLAALFQSDDKTLLLVSIDFMSNKGSVMKFSTETNTISGEARQMTNKMATSSAITKVPGEDIIFFTNNARTGTIFKYNYQTQTEETFANATTDIELAVMNINPNDYKLYFSYKLQSQIRQYRTLIYDSKTTVPASPVGNSYSLEAFEIFQIDFNFSE